ncbi:MAG: hypothetical protein SF182_12395 [Deltaproteobacteria bacterium]|nr:hypothetical protein [Deltaproteobacteria bacterium]
MVPPLIARQSGLRRGADLTAGGGSAKTADVQTTPALIAASALLACCIAVIWLGAPVVPAVIGGVGAAAILLWRNRRR